MEMVCPRSVGAVGDESGFQNPVHSFHDAVGFGVVGRCMVTRGAEELVEEGPKEGYERGTSVGGNVHGDAESGDPYKEEGCST